MKTDHRHSPKLSRRKFISTSSGVMLFVGASGVLPQLVSCTDSKSIKRQLIQHSLTAWVKITTDGTITIYNPAAEMGQGSMTSLPVLFAEEMDAAWKKVKVEFSPQESSIYGSEGWGPNRKIMLSAGSRVTKGYFRLMRNAGAQARHILLHSMARKWNVPMDELSTEPHRIIHAGSGKKINYGQVIEFIEMPENLPEFEVEQLKSPDDFRLIGVDQPRTDIPSKINGSAQFAIDIKLPDMLYGILERGRIHGARPILKNEEDIRKINGVMEVVKLDHAIGILSDRLERALEAKKMLDIEWADAESAGFSSDNAYAEYERIASSAKKEKVVTNIGNIQKALNQSERTYEVDYKNDYVYHAQMEPLNSIVQVAEDGQHAEAWVGSQQGFDSKLGIPGILGIPPENVTIHLQYLGGGFGRRSMTDFVTECAQLAKVVAPKPVKLIWTREDDLTYGAYRPMSLQRLKASTDPKGNITGLAHYVIGDGDNLVASGIKNEYYAIPNQYAELRIVPHGVRLKHWRAVGHGPNKFAIESLLDEIAFDQGKDPVALRRKLMEGSPRALMTLDKAAEMANWGESKEDRAKGVAFLERSGTLSTGICEISVDRNTGKIRVHHFWSAHDAGIVIQPDNVKAQIEGGIIMGMSSVLKERLSIKDGRVQQSNFNDYHLLRMEEIPESIETAIIHSDQPPQGVGESGTPLVACAIANAFFALTGKKLRHLPFTPERVLSSLES